MRANFFGLLGVCMSKHIHARRDLLNTWHLIQWTVPKLIKLQKFKLSAFHFKIENISPLRAEKKSFYCSATD